MTTWKDLLKSLVLFAIAGFVFYLGINLIVAIIEFVVNFGLVITR